MVNNFLDKVVEQIVSETEVSNGEVYFPFLNGGFPRRAMSPTKIRSYLLYNFFEHCESVYGLNYDETEYIWKEYKEIIKDKIENNG